MFLYREASAHGAGYCEASAHGAGYRKAYTHRMVTARFGFHL
jgi:hypothetical protein